MLPRRPVRGRSQVTDHEATRSKRGPRTPMSAGSGTSRKRRGCSLRRTRTRRRTWKRGQNCDSDSGRVLGRLRARYTGTSAASTAPRRNVRARAALAAGRFMVSDLAPSAHGTLREHGQRRSFSHAGGQTQHTCACLTDPSNVCGRTCERTHLQEACRLQTHFRGTVAATWCRTQLTPSLRARVGARMRTMTTAAVARTLTHSVSPLHA